MRRARVACSSDSLQTDSLCLQVNSLPSDDLFCWLMLNSDDIYVSYRSSVLTMEATAILT